MTRLGILGAGGQLGRCLIRSAEKRSGIDLAFALSRSELDVTDASAGEALLDSAAASGLDVVVNASGFTKVDACESETDRAYAINADAPIRWAKSLARRGVRFIHVSTDYVFPGEGPLPYREADATAPRSVYGLTKRAGEEGVLAADPSALVVRTSWVFGPGRNFVLAILDQAAKRRSGETEGPLSVVDDQLGSPTSAADLAEALLTICEGGSAPLKALSGLLHLRNAGETSWFGFAREILDQGGFSEIAIDPVATAAFPTPAPRPAYSVLNCDKADSLGLRMRAWPDALSSYLAGPDRPPVLDAVPVESVTCAFPGHEGQA